MNKEAGLANLGRSSLRGSSPQAAISEIRKLWWSFLHTLSTFPFRPGYSFVAPASEALVLDKATRISTIHMSSGLHSLPTVYKIRLYT